MSSNPPFPEVPSSSIDPLELLGREDLLKMVRSMMSGGVVLTFHGKQLAHEICKKVRPRVLRRETKLCVGTPHEQCKNLLVEGENLQAMVTLYKYRGEVDLIVTDPPFNTGQHFRYNDRWDSDPNDPDLGTIVSREDGSRHTKWMKAMLPRLHMMKMMLKPGGVIAVCIDENELFHLGKMMDEEFGESNRLGIINWQKSYSPKNNSTHISTATEYVLIYSKDKSLTKKALEPRTEAMSTRYKNPDNDPEGPWDSGDPTRPREGRDRDKYGIQSPFTGAIFYPGSTSWRIPKKDMKPLLEKWGSKYVDKNIGDGRNKALVLVEGIVPSIPDNQNLDDYPTVESEEVFSHPLIVEARRKAEGIRDNGVIPFLHFLKNGYGRPRIKRYENYVKQGKVPLTYWADEDYDSPFQLGTQSWDHEESGHSQSGINELDSIVGKGHGFETVKPLKLFKKIIQLWCPNNGLVLDPYGGSGTTGHAVLELNYETGSNRRFILIEQGSPENADKYARTLTWTRLKNVVTGERTDQSGRVTAMQEPLGGGFSFQMLTKQIDAKTVLAMKRDELVDVVITSHWEDDRRGSPGLIRVDDPKYTYLVGRNERNEGYFIIWNGKDSVDELNKDTYRAVLNEAKRAELIPPYNVYARYEVYQSPNVRFWKIPDKILAHLGLNENSDKFNEDEEF